MKVILFFLLVAALISDFDEFIKEANDTAMKVVLAVNLIMQEDGKIPVDKEAYDLAFKNQSH
jgi:hypothetical protein